MMGFLQAVISADPPVESGYNAAMMNNGGPSYFPPQQAAIPNPQPMQAPTGPYGAPGFSGYPPNPYGAP